MALRSLPSFRPRSRKAWRAWLTKRHATSAGVWVVFAKKHTGLPSLTYDDAVEEALCFGWIDSLKHPVDDRFYTQAFTPRKPKSAWSAPNRARVKKMVAAGLMTAAGLALVALAKKSGTWEARKHVEDLEVPPDLQAAFKRNPAATAQWAGCTPGTQKRYLYWLNDARRAETRATRVAGIVDRITGKATPTGGG